MTMKEIQAKFEEQQKLIEENFETLNKKIQANFEVQKKMIMMLREELNEIKGVSKEIKDERFKRRGKGEKYFVLNSKGKVFDNSAFLVPFGDEYYDTANYCSDEKLIKKRAAEEILSRLIWREAEIANAKLTDRGGNEYYITYDRSYEKFVYTLASPSLLGAEGFAKWKDAEDCVKNVVIPFVNKHPELGWKLNKEEN